MRIQQPVTVALLGAIIIWLAIRVIWPRLRGSNARYRRLTAARHWDDPQQTSVAGGAYYRDAIAAVSHLAEAGKSCTAYLVPEHNNEYDGDAVAVVIGGRLVGYLSPRDAASLRRRLNAAGIAGAVTSCAARIGAGDGDEMSCAITLGLAVDAQ